MTKVRFSDSSKSTILKQSVISGKIYVASDTHELYFDTLDGERIKISDIEYLATNEDREDILAPLNKFYYVSDTNKLWFYNEKWVQIGPGSKLIIQANGTQLGSYTGEEPVTVNITKANIGLGNVPNVATNDQTPTYTVSSSLTALVSGEKLSVALGKIAKAVSDLISHLANKSNPHGVTKSQVSLGNVTNDKQIKGLASGTTAGHVVEFGADGYTVQDSGFTIGKSVPSNAVFTDTNTWIAFKGATASAAGTAGYVPAPSAGYNTRFFRGDGTWQAISLSTFGITATSNELNILDGATVTVQEINYLDGVTSNIQTQLNGKAPTTHTHNYAGSSSAGGSANSAVKLQTSRKINGVSFDGSKDINIPTNYFVQLTDEDLDEYLTLGECYGAGGNSVTNKPSGVEWFYLKVFKSASGYTGQSLYSEGIWYSRYYNGTDWTDWSELYSSTNKPSPADIGAAAASHGTHVTYGTSAPLAPGTASAGSASSVSRSDHRHPAQTSVSGNAGTATKLKTARTINGVAFDGSKNITIGVDDGVIE